MPRINPKPPKSPPWLIINEIKRVWKLGMTSADIANALSPTYRLSKASIVGYFHRWGEELKPCHLTAANGSKTKVKEAKIKQNKPRKNTKFVATGYVAKTPLPKNPIFAPPTIRDDAEGPSEKVLRSFKADELQRKREKAHHPEPRVGEKFKSRSGISLAKVFKNDGEGY